MVGLIMGCTKSDNDSNAKVLENISAIADGNKLQFKDVTATYLVNFNTLILTGSTIDNKEIELGVYVSGPNGMGTYNFEPMGTNTARYTYLSQNNNSTGYIHTYSDYDRSALNGQITITKLDLVAKKLSGTFAFKTYESYTNSYHDIKNGFFNDIKLDTNLTLNYLNYMECETSMGTNWFTDRVGARTIETSVTDTTLRVEAFSAVGSRFLGFNIPFHKGTGTFNLGTGGEHTVFFSMHRERFFYPFGAGGTITITELNQGTRTIKAVFNNVQLKDENGNIVTFNNGVLQLDYWDKR
jgi:Family of unknown function (DUF6252)